MDGPIPGAIPSRAMNTTTLSRRELIRSASLTAAASLLPLSALAAQAPAPNPNPNMKLKPPTPAQDLPVRLGIASYTFRQFDTAHLIDFMHELKTPFLDLKDMHLKMGPSSDVAQQAAAYRAAGFKLVAAGNVTFAKDDDEDIRQKFEYIKAAGIPMIVCAPTHQNLPRLEKFVKEYNIKLAIHNHGPEDKNFPSPFDVLDAVKNLDQRIGLCMDLGHSLRAGADVVQAVHTAGPRLHAMHIKDLADATSRESQVAVGEGIMPVKQVFEALMQIKYPGTVDLEYEIKGDNPMPGVVESFAYMRGVLAGMGYK